MKTTRKIIFSAVLFAALWINAAGPQADAPREKQPGVAEPNTGAPTPAPDAKTADKPAAEQQANPAATEGGPAPVPTTAAANPPSEGEVRLNFRGVPLEMVLNHLSDAAGFIINIKPGTDIKGKVDVWSSQPLSKDEAVDFARPGTLISFSIFVPWHCGQATSSPSKTSSSKEWSHF